MPFRPFTPALMHQLGRVRHFAGRWLLLGSAVVLAAKVCGVSADTKMPDLLDAIIGAAYSPVALLGTLIVPVGMATAKVAPYATLDFLSRRYGIAAAGTARQRFKPSVERSISDMADSFYRILTLMIAAYLGLWAFAPQPCLLILAVTCGALLGVMVFAFTHETAAPEPSGAMS